MRNNISTFVQNLAPFAVLLVIAFGLVANTASAVGPEKIWTSNFNAPANGPHDKIVVDTNKKGNNVSKVEYSTDGGTTWNTVTHTVTKNGTPTKISVAPETIPDGAKVRVTGSNAHSDTDPTPSGGIN